MFERIPVPLDGSELAEAILPAARDLAATFDSDLILLQVIEWSPRMRSESNSPAVPLESRQVVRGEHARTMAEASDYLDAVSTGLAGEHFGTRKEVLEGQPGDTILSYARDAGISLICLSSRGRGGLGRLVFGSVADHLLKNSSFPVLLLRPPA